MRCVRTLVLPLIVLGFAACGENTTEPASTTATTSVPGTDQPDVAGPDGDWVVVAGVVGGEPVGLVDGYDITLSISAGEISGTAACNGYGGVVEHDDGEIRIGELSWTEMGCEPDVQALEQTFLQSLLTVGSYRLDEGQLVLVGPDAEWTFEAAPNA
jgi:heat shock protein HslJ